MKKYDICKKCLCGAISVILFMHCPVNAESINVPAMVGGIIATVLGVACLAQSLTLVGKDSKIKKLEEKVRSFQNKQLDNESQKVCDSHSRLKETQLCSSPEYINTMIALRDNRIEAIIPRLQLLFYKCNQDTNIVLEKLNGADNSELQAIVNKIQSIVNAKYSAHFNSLNMKPNEIRAIANECLDLKINKELFELLKGKDIAYLEGLADSLDEQLQAFN